MKVLLSTRTHPPQAVEAIALELGFDGIEVVMPSRIKRMAPVNYDGLTHVYAVHAPLDYYDSPRFSQALKDAVAVAGQLGATLVTIHPPSAHPSCGGAMNVHQGLHLLKNYAVLHRCTIACEVLSRPKTPVHELQQAYRAPRYWLLDIVQHEVAATLDTTHVAAWNEDPTQYIGLLNQRLRHVHVSDYARKDQVEHLFPGTGDLNWPEFLGALRQQSQQQEISITLEPGARFDLVQHRDHLTESLALIRRYC
ncbi:MAG: sugar phosphate isomerase/epimerase [Candidatus Andersenbacteria bacterium]